MIESGFKLAYFKSRAGYNGARTVHYIEEARLLLLSLIEKCQEI